MFLSLFRSSGALLQTVCIAVSVYSVVSFGAADASSPFVWMPDQETSVRAFLHKGVETGEIPGGTLLLMRGGSVLFHEGFGYADVERKTPFSADGPCRIASLSKPLIATLVVLLASDGVLALDRALSDYLPEFRDARRSDGKPLSRVPTVRECLSHTAGFTPDKAPGGRPWLRLSRKGLTLADVVRREAEAGFHRNPGEAFGYSGIGYDVAGRIVEVATGRPLNDVLRERLCEPLGMTHTTYYPDAATRAGLPKQYLYWRSDGRLHPRRERAAIPEGKYISVGGGIVSTAGDWARFLEMHRNRGVFEGRRIVPEEALREMRVPCSPATRYGLGFMLKETPKGEASSRIMHTGSSGTLFQVDFETSTTLVLFTQCRAVPGRGADAVSDRNAGPGWLTRARRQVEEILGMHPEPARKGE